MHLSDMIACLYSDYRYSAPVVASGIVQTVGSRSIISESNEPKKILKPCGYKKRMSRQANGH